MFMLLAGGLLIILLAVVIAVVSSVVSAVAAATDDAEDWQPNFGLSVFFFAIIALPPNPHEPAWIPGEQSQ